MRRTDQRDLRMKRINRQLRRNSRTFDLMRARRVKTPSVVAEAATAKIT
jgi:hypothetical protein